VESESESGKTASEGFTTPSVRPSSEHCQVLPDWGNQRYHLWTIAFRVLPVTENTFVWLKIAAPSDLLLDVVCLINVLTYLPAACIWQHVKKDHWTPALVRKPRPMTF